jgi:superfamily I DNA/RNA helicase
MFAIALAQYQTALNERSLLDFSDVLQRAVDLLGRMDEFSQSRYRLEGRYHHVLVDEFQDTSRKQWSWFRCWSNRGAKALVLRTIRRSSSSGIASSRSTASATPTSRSCTRPAASSTPFVRDRPHGDRSPAASARSRSCWRS